MSEIKTPNLASITPENIPGLSTTAQLIVALVKAYFDVLDRAYDTVLARSASVFAGFGQAVEKMNSLNNDVSIRANAREILDTLKTVNTPSAKATYETLNSDASPALQKSEELEKNARLLYERIEADRQIAFKALENALNASDPNSQEILNQLNTAEKTLQSLKVELEKLKKARAVNDGQLGKIAHSGYAALSSKERSSVSPPPTLTTPHTPGN